jgi:hypothetical protein
MASILDVIDNYISFHKENDILKIPGKRLFELGEEVRRFRFTLEGGHLQTFGPLVPANF